MLIFALSIAFADPQDIPEEDNDSEDDSSTDQNDSSEDRSENNASEKSTPLNSPVDSAEILEKKLLMENSDAPSDDLDLSWFRGDINYSYDLRFWEMNGKAMSLSSGTFAGDPQYLWELQDEIGPCFGLRFRLSSADSQEMRVRDNLIGLTTGFQIGSVRLNIAGSYFFNHLFHQEEISRDSTTDEILYRYKELRPFHGILWENTLSLNLGSKLILQGHYAIPIELGGERDTGALFRDSWQVGSELVYNNLLFGYQYSIFPDSEESILLFGMSFGR